MNIKGDQNVYNKKFLSKKVMSGIIRERKTRENCASLMT